MHLSLFTVVFSRTSFKFLSFANKFVLKITAEINHFGGDETILDMSYEIEFHLTSLFINYLSIISEKSHFI